MRRVLVRTAAVVLVLHGVMLIVSFGGERFGIHSVLAAVAAFGMGVSLYPEKLFEFYSQPGLGTWQDEPTQRRYQMMRLTGVVVALLATIAGVAAL